MNPLAADVLHWADEHNGALQAAATIVLVLVTIAYVRVTSHMAKATRRQAELAFAARRDTHRVALINVGEAPALEVRATVKFVPKAGDEHANWADDRRFGPALLMPGGAFAVLWHAPQDHKDDRQNAEHFLEHIDRIEVNATFRQRGETDTRKFKETIRDLKQLAEDLKVLSEDENRSNRDLGVRFVREAFEQIERMSPPFPP